MFKQLQLLLGGLSVAAAAASSAAATSAKREISDAHHSSGAYADSFPLAVTATLGSDAFAPAAYAGSLGNLYGHVDDEGLVATGYAYPQYALGYGRYEPYAADVGTPALSLEDLGDDDVVWGTYYGGRLLPYGRRFGGSAEDGYAYGAFGRFARPDFYLGRLGIY